MDTRNLKSFDTMMYILKRVVAAINNKMYSIILVMQDGCYRISVKNKKDKVNHTYYIKDFEDMNIDAETVVWKIIGDL